MRNAARRIRRRGTGRGRRRVAVRAGRVHADRRRGVRAGHGGHGRVRLLADSHHSRFR